MSIISVLTKSHSWAGRGNSAELWECRVEPPAGTAVTPLLWLFLNFGGNQLSACISWSITSVMLCDLFMCSLLSFISSLGWYHQTENPFFFPSPETLILIQSLTGQGKGWERLVPAVLHQEEQKRWFWNSQTWTEQLLKPSFYCIFNVSSLWLQLMGEEN